MASRQMSDRFRPRTAARRRRTVLFLGLFLLSVLVGLVGLASLLAQILWQGLPYLSINFLFDFPSRFADQAPESSRPCSAHCGSWLSPRYS